MERELKLLRGIAISIACVTVIGLAAAFGGLQIMAMFFGAPAPHDVDPGLRNDLRAICACFMGFGLLAVWSLYDLEARKTAFRIVGATAVVAGLARVTGWIVDGYPGMPHVVFLAAELVVFPLLLLWHARLLRLARASRA